MTATVCLSNVVKEYVRGTERITVLHDLHLECLEGEFLALMGPSGSGKTTLLNLISGLDRPSKGSITVGERRIDRLSQAKLAQWRARHVGFIFQFYNLMPMLTAEENVEVPLRLTHLSREQRRTRVAAALELVDLRGRARHHPAELSGGQQQRVAIARAIVTDPTLLICDEPTGDLDRARSEEILGLLQFLNREQRKTIVMVTHDPLAAGRASRRLYLDKGRFTAEEAGQTATHH